MDDLFGDGDTDGFGAALAATLDSDVLLQRVEQSHIVGCCQKLAWSKNGSVASVSSDGRKIAVKVIIRDRVSGEWSLRDHSQQPIIAPDDAIFCHVEWGPYGFELVATDQYGRLHLYTLAVAINRFTLCPTNFQRTEDDLNVIVGLYWLPINSIAQRVALMSTATKDKNNRWASTLKIQDTTAVSHPFEQERAFLCVTRNNHLKLVYQQPRRPWSEMVLGLGDLMDSGDVLTHAAFGDAQNHLLLTTYDATKRLRVYRINIVWNPNIGENQQPLSVSPQLQVSHVQLLENCTPRAQNSAMHNNTSLMGSIDSGTAELSNLIVLPPPSGTSGSLTVTAVYVKAGNDSNLSQSRYSVIARWELQQSNFVLHDSFRSLSSNAEKSPSNKQTTVLQRLDDTIFANKILLSVGTNYYNSMLTLAASDGSVEFRHSHDMSLITADGSPDSATSLPQNGFTVIATDCTDIALSPVGCMAVTARPDGSIHFHSAEYLHGWTNTMVDRDLHQAAVVSLAREMGIFTCHQLGTDDLLAMIPAKLDQDLRRKVIAELFRSVSRNTDYSMEDLKQQSGKVMKDGLLYRVLSAQLVLGYKDDPAYRDTTGKVAWAMLNLRAVCTSVAHSTHLISQRTPQGQIQETLVSFRGVIKWSFDLLTLILDDLFTIMRAGQEAELTRDFLQSHVNTTSTLSIHIILHSAPRSLLRILCEILRNYYNKLLGAKSITRSSGERAALEDIEALGSTLLPFRSISIFEQFLLEIDSQVRKAYEQSKASPALRSQIEQAMLVEAAVPEILMPVLNNLFSEILPKLEQRVDGAAVFTADTSWLGLGDDEKSRAALRANRIDVLRKTEIPAEMKVRQCRRCGSVIEDVVEWASPPPTWIATGHKTCICSSHWVVL